MSTRPKRQPRALLKATSSVIPFNPLEKKVLGASLAEVLLTTRVYPLTTPFPFRGPGVYAIYYTGSRFAPYKPLAQQNSGRCVWPIYVGQALPSGGRRGIAPKVESPALKNRLLKHGRSITAASEDLGIEDFQYRALVMDDAFIRLAETSLLALYKPLWNTFVAGFGNNDPGGGRDASKRSRWDTLHGGRVQAAGHLDRNESREQVIAEITQELANTNFNLPDSLITAAGQSIHGLEIDLSSAIGAEGDEDLPKSGEEEQQDAS